MDVKKLREKYGWTQQELAEMCGVTLRTVQNWETGKPIPTSMMKLLKVVEDSHEMISSGDAAQYGVSVAAGKGSQVNLATDMERFFTTLERQQELMSRQLEEMAEMRRQTQKKDEQIDTLLCLLKTKLTNQQ